MERYEYMLIPTKMIPKDIMDKYNLDDKQHNGVILGEIQKGMYGLPQAGRLVYDKLITHLTKGGYPPHTPLDSFAIAQTTPHSASLLTT